VLQTVCRTTSNEQLARNVECVRLLRSAGADVEVRLNDQAVDPISSEVRFLDHWVMGNLNRTAMV